MDNETKDALNRPAKAQTVVDFIQALTRALDEKPPADPVARQRWVDPVEKQRWVPLDPGAGSKDPAYGTCTRCGRPCERSICWDCWFGAQ